MTQTIHSTVLLVLLAVLLLSVAATTPAQSLGEVARQYRKELKAREKKGEVPVRLFTNDDIARMPPIAILKSSMQTPSSPETKPSEQSQPSGAAAGGTQPDTTVAPSGKARKHEKSKEYWESKFKPARARLAHAKEEQTLVADELHLLQIQQARQLDPDRSRKLKGQIDASTIELEAKRAATIEARSALEQLEKEFKDSGAPKDWIQGSAKPH